MSEEKFKKGDIVEWCGTRGVVDCIPLEGDIWVKFCEGNREANFDPDGRYYLWHKEPSLILIERPKKKVKKTFYFASWKSKYEYIGRECTNLFLEKGNFDDLKDKPDFQLHEIEIDVEE